jgi:hypothetical protein
MIWMGLIAIQLFVFGLNEFMGTWPGSLLVLVIPVVPGAVLWWWGKSQMRRSMANA